MRDSAVNAAIVCFVCGIATGAGLMLIALMTPLGN